MKWDTDNVGSSGGARFSLALTQASAGQSNLAASKSMTFNVILVAQSGRLEYEAALFAASLRATDPAFAGRVLVAEPQPGPLWQRDPRISDPSVRDLLLKLGAEIIPFSADVFGDSYPQGNKIEALAAMPKGHPFIFFDSDTLVCGALSDLTIPFERPAASMRREDTWPKLHLYGPNRADIWTALYRHFEFDIAPTLDTAWPKNHWRRYLYFNAGWCIGPCPQAFAQTWLRISKEIRDNPPPELLGQSLDPWLDQVALPLAIHALGGGRPGPELDGLDGAVTCHWRALPLLFARESDHVVETLREVTAPHRIKKVLKAYEPFRHMIYHQRGTRIREMFDRNALPRTEREIRKRLKAKNLWSR